MSESNIFFVGDGIFEQNLQFVQKWKNHGGKIKLFNERSFCKTKKRQYYLMKNLRNLLFLFFHKVDVLWKINLQSCLIHDLRCSFSYNQHRLLCQVMRPVDGFSCTICSLIWTGNKAATTAEELMTNHLVELRNQDLRKACGGLTKKYKMLKIF